MPPDDKSHSFTNFLGFGCHGLEMILLLWRAFVTRSLISFRVERVGIKSYLLLFNAKENIIENTVSSYKFQAVFFPLCSDHKVLLIFFYTLVIYLYLIEEPSQNFRERPVREIDLSLSTLINVLLETGHFDFKVRVYYIS